MSVSTSIQQSISRLRSRLYAAISFDDKAEAKQVPKFTNSVAYCVSIHPDVYKTLPTLLGEGENWIRLRVSFNSQLIMKDLLGVIPKIVVSHLPNTPDDPRFELRAIFSGYRDRPARIREVDVWNMTVQALREQCLRRRCLVLSVQTITLNQDR